ncbi:MAG: alpha/beta hydrolase [Bacteroidota bacterium]
MISLRGSLFRFILKHNRSKRKKVDWNTKESVIRFRQECEAGASRFGKLPDGIGVVPFKIGDIPAEWIFLSQLKKDRVIFYLHGGGYVSGSCADHRIHVAKFVKGSGVSALLFEYRLAPEHPFPAAIEDSVTAYRWLLKQGTSPSQIVFAGDSAGGGLCLVNLLALKDQDVPLPKAAVALSPWTDLKCTGDSYRTNATKCMSPEGTWTAFSKHYVGDNDPCLPLISPLYGDLRGLPPLLIYAGGDEILRDDSIRFADKAKAAGVDVTLKVGKGLFHCYPVCAPLFPEATRAMNEICAFIKTQLGN